MTIEIKRLSYVMQVPRELLLDAGVIQPTAAQRAEHERRAAEHAAKLEAARKRLARVVEPLGRALLDLHGEDEFGECQGCDFAGYEADRPDWPCRTVEAVASHYAIELP